MKGLSARSLDGNPCLPLRGEGRRQNLRLVSNSRWLGGLLVVLLLGGWQPAKAEVYKINFNKNSNRMSWRPTLPSWSYAVPVTLSGADTTSKLRINASASLSSSLDQRSSGNTWSDNASLRSSVNYPILGPKASIGISASMSSRSATLQKQKIRNQSFSFNFKYNPLTKGRFRSVSVGVTPGLITASRASRARPDSTIKETGIQYNASLRVSPELEIAGKKLSNSFSLSKRDNTLKSNKNRSETLSSSVGYTFPHEVRSSLRLSESRSQQGLTRAVIGQGDTSVVSELSERRNTSVSSSIDFKLGRIDVKTNGSFNEAVNANTSNDDPDSRFFARDRESQGWGFDLKLSGKLLGNLVGRSSLNYSFDEEKRLSVQLDDGRFFRDTSDDRRDRNLSANGSLDWPLAENHSLNLSGQARSIHDDHLAAPELDRDTFSSTASLKYTGKRTSGVSVDVNLNTNFSHRVSLDATRSSNNSRNRDLDLNISTRYERLGTTLSHRFGVSAKRVIFDFDQQVNLQAGDRRSNIRRAWSMSHSVRRKFFKALSSNFTYSFNADDFGTLLTENGAQIVNEENTDHAIRFGFTYSPNKDFSLGTNYSFRLDRQWELLYRNRQAERSLLRENQHRNLSLNLRYAPSELTALSMRFSRAKQRSGTFDTFTVDLSRTI